MESIKLDGNECFTSFVVWLMQERSELKPSQEELWKEGVIPYVQQREIRRLSWNNLGHEVAEAFNLSRGLFYTMVGLTIRPAATIREYLNEGRYRIISPARYFVLVVGLVLFVAVQKGFSRRAQKLLRSR